MLVQRHRCRRLAGMSQLNRTLKRRRLHERQEELLVLFVTAGWITAAAEDPKGSMRIQEGARTLAGPIFGRSLIEEA